MSVRSGSDSSSSGTISIMNMQRPVVDVFVERFVDAFAPEVDVKSGRAGALRAAAGIRMFSPLISDAYEAVSVAFFGRSVQNKQIEASGFRLYPRVLRGLQDALNDPERCKAESTLVTVILLLAFESVERTTQSGVSAHVRGAVRLIEHRGPENHMYGVEHLMFTELRPYWVCSYYLPLLHPNHTNDSDWRCTRGQETILFGPGGMEDHPMVSGHNDQRYPTSPLGPCRRYSRPASPVRRIPRQAAGGRYGCA